MGVPAWVIGAVINVVRGQARRRMYAILFGMTRRIRPDCMSERFSGRLPQGGDRRAGETSADVGRRAVVPGVTLNVPARSPGQPT